MVQQDMGLGGGGAEDFAFAAGGACDALNGESQGFKQSSDDAFRAVGG